MNSQTRSVSHASEIQPALDELGTWWGSLPPGQAIRAVLFLEPGVYEVAALSIPTGVTLQGLHAVTLETDVEIRGGITDLSVRGHATAITHGVLQLSHTWGINRCSIVSIDTAPALIVKTEPTEGGWGGYINDSGIHSLGPNAIHYDAIGGGVVEYHIRRSTFESTGNGTGGATIELEGPAALSHKFTGCWVQALQDANWVESGGWVIFHHCQFDPPNFAGKKVKVTVSPSGRIDTYSPAGLKDNSSVPPGDENYEGFAQRIDW